MFSKFLRIYRRTRDIVRTYSSAEPLTGIACIEIKNPPCPVTLMCEWFNEAKHFQVKTDIMTLATTNKSGKISNKNVFIKEILPDASLTFMAMSYSNKIKDIKENPQVAATYLLHYKIDGTNIFKQISFMGKAEPLPKEKCNDYFLNEPLPRKMAYALSQNCKSDWNDLKTRHDQLFKEFIEVGKVPPMPLDLVAYKVVTSQIEFYFSSCKKVGDRILFELESDKKWKYERLSP